jgi:hypothetical protein
MFPGRSPGSRHIDPIMLSKSKFGSTTHPRLPVLSTVASCEQSSRLQWRYRSGFSPLSLLVTSFVKKIATPRNHAYSIDYSRLIAKCPAVNHRQLLGINRVNAFVRLRRHLNIVLDILSEQTGNHRSVHRTNNIEHSDQQVNKYARIAKMG